MKDIIFITGQTGSGKDTIIKQLIEKMPKINFINHVIYTTRKPRVGETDNSPYNFIERDNIIELSDYNIVSNREYEMLVKDEFKLVSYISVDLGNKLSSPDDKNSKIIAAGALDMMRDYVNYYGIENMKLFYIDAPFDVRLNRTINRENIDPDTLPELCRRLYKDHIDYLKFAKYYENIMSSIHRIDNSKDDDSAVNSIISLLS